jgi:hypothetical protein
MKRTHGRSIMTKVVVIGDTGLIGSKVREAAQFPMTALPPMTSPGYARC